MKIVLFSFLFEPEIGGGAAVVVNQLARLLISQSFAVVIITTWKGKFVQTEFIDEIKVIRIPSSNIYWVGDKDNQPIFRKAIWQLIDIWNPFVYKLVRQILASEMPDIVHTHKLRGLSPSIWSAAASLGVKKIVHTCHDYELLSPEGYFMGRIGQLARNQNIVLRPYQRIRSGFSELLTNVTAPSRYVMDFHQKMGFFKNAVAQVIPNSHNFSHTELLTRVTSHSKSKNRTSAVNFVYLGRLDTPKGVDTLCQAFFQARQSNPTIHLKISGWGPQEQALKEKYLKTNLEFAGSLFGEKKHQFLQESDVLVAPSIFEEPFGIVISEAFAFGKPVIASRIGAFPELVEPGKTGLLVAPNSVEELKNAIIKFSASGGIGQTISANCFQSSLKYTTDIFITNYLAVYSSKL